MADEIKIKNDKIKYKLPSKIVIAPLSIHIKPHSGGSTLIIKIPIIINGIKTNENFCQILFTLSEKIKLNKEETIIKNGKKNKYIYSSKNKKL